MLAPPPLNPWPIQYKIAHYAHYAPVKEFNHVIQANQSDNPLNELQALNTELAYQEVFFYGWPIWLIGETRWKIVKPG